MSFYTGVLLRLGKTEEIEKQYNEGYLRFSCPANWINYAKTHPDGIADKYEGVFAHVKKDDPRLSMICDDGVPLNKYRSLWNEECDDGMLYPRYIFSCLVPAICFYSIDVRGPFRYFEVAGNSDRCLMADLRPYYKAMGINRDEYSILAVCSPNKLDEELVREIPKAVEKAENIDKSDFRKDNPLHGDYVKYDLEIKEEFWEFHPYDELYRKRPKFKRQSEARFIIPNVSFVRDPVYRPDLYQDNEMNVPVPNLKSYSMVVPASNINTMAFMDVSEDLKGWEIGFYNKTMDEVHVYKETGGRR